MGDFDYYDIETGEGIDDYELEERYVDMLDECYPDVSIAGYTYTTSNALRSVDPIAFRVGFADWISGELGETITEEAPTAD